MLASDVPRVATVFAGFGDTNEVGDEEKFAGGLICVEQCPLHLVEYVFVAKQFATVHPRKRLYERVAFPRLTLRNANVLPDERRKARGYRRVAILKVFPGVHHGLRPWGQAGEADEGKGNGGHFIPQTTAGSDRSLSNSALRNR